MNEDFLLSCNKSRKQNVKLQIQTWQTTYKCCNFIFHSYNSNLKDLNSCSTLKLFFKSPTVPTVLCYIFTLMVPTIVKKLMLLYLLSVCTIKRLKISFVILFMQILYFFWYKIIDFPEIFKCNLFYHVVIWLCPSR